MAYFTMNKRGKMGKKIPEDRMSDVDHSPATMYSAVEFGAGHPDGSRRLTNNYGKTARKRNEFKPEVGENSRRTGRMFNWMKGESY